jgi:hypothetical protein
MQYKVQLTAYGFTTITADNWDDALEKVQDLDVSNFDISNHDIEILEEIDEEPEEQ